VTHVHGHHPVRVSLFGIALACRLRLDGNRWRSELPRYLRSIVAEKGHLFRRHNYRRTGANRCDNCHRFGIVRAALESAGVIFLADGQ
jgi:hypothetical protein